VSPALSPDLKPCDNYLLGVIDMCWHIYYLIKIKLTEFILFLSDFYLIYPLSNVIMNLKLSCVIKQYALNIIVHCKAKAKHSHYRPMGPRRFWEVKASRFRDIGT
jgi:hypothetical protein